jgi:hypothetical protein
MKKTAKKLLSLLIMMLILSPGLAWAKPGDDALINCGEHDIECIENIIGPSVARCFTFTGVVGDVSASWIDYNSRLFNVAWRVDANGSEVFRSLYPSLTKLIEKDLASKYGIVFPLKKTANKRGLGDIGSIFDIVDAAIHVFELYDERFNEPRINAMIDDLERRGYSHDNAVVEANQQFIERIQPNSQVIASLFGPPGSAVVGMGNLLRDLEILGSGKYYNLWAQFHRAEIREILRQQAAGRRGPDTGRSYIEWAARRDQNRDISGSFWDNCAAWIYYPAYEEWDPATSTLIYHPARAVCIVNRP